MLSFTAKDKPHQFPERIDPQLSIMTDDVMDGRISEGRFRRAITALVGARVVGTLAAQILRVPSAIVIAGAAELL